MSETIEDSIEMNGVYLRKSVCSILYMVTESYYVFPSRHIEKLVLLFDNNTCLMSARSRAVAQRVRVMTDPQTEWGGREVSPFCGSMSGVTIY